MFALNIQKIFKSRRLYQTIALFLSGILVGILPDLAVAGGITVIVIIAAIAIFTWIASLLLPKGHRFDVIIKSPETITSPQEEQLYARQVFIGFVPLFTPQSDRGKALSPDERQQAIENLDFAALDIENSNFKPTIKAIVSHKSQLKHCWLLATTVSSPNSVGSLAYAELLTEYLKQQYNLTCEFHFGQNYTISMDEDSLVLGKTYRLVEGVFEEISRNLDTNRIIADITTGVRSMTLGMILACLDEERDIQFIGTKYNENGRPEGSLKPIIFSFAPKESRENQA